MWLKYFSVLCLLVFMRGCDFYSTSLWFFQENGAQSESNPLVRHLGLGWNSLVVTNVVMVLVIAVLYYIYLFVHTRKMQQRIMDTNGGLLPFASRLYFGSPGRPWRIMYKFANDKSISLAHAGYALMFTLIFASGVATLHNIFSFYGYEFYRSFKATIGHVLYLYYFLFFVVGCLTLWRAIQKDYEVVKLRQQLSNGSF